MNFLVILPKIFPYLLFQFIKFEFDVGRRKKITQSILPCVGANLSLSFTALPWAEIKLKMLHNKILHQSFHFTDQENFPENELVKFFFDENVFRCQMPQKIHH